jgi:thymidylate kinase
MKVVIALEGGVCSGKSSASRIAHESGAAVLFPDYMDTIPENRYEAISKLGPIERTAIFLELDQRRLASIEAAKPSQILLDRCVLTIFAFEYACVATGRNARHAGLVELAERYSLAYPDKVIFLDVSDAVRATRESARRSHVLPIFLEPNFNSSIREFFTKAAEFVPVRFVNSEANSADQIAKIAYEQFTEVPPVQKSVEFWNPLLSWAFK